MNAQSAAGFRLLCARALRRCVQAVRRQIEPVRAGANPKAVHRMRVASRRLRAALTLFEPVLPPRLRRRWRRVIRRVTRALGPARDADIQLELVDRLLAAARACGEDPAVSGLERVRLRYCQRREAQGPAIARAMDRLERSAALDHMSELARSAIRQARAGRVECGGPAALAHGRRVVRRRRAAMLALQRAVQQPEQGEKLHALRIAAKRLRYSLELLEPLQGVVPRRVVRVLKRIQKLLGDLHDCDVWLLELPGFLEEERGRTVRYFGDARGLEPLQPGLDLLAEDRRRHRERVYRRFVKYWRSHAEAGIWRRLLEPAGAPGRPAETRPAETPPGAAEPAEPQGAAEPAEPQGVAEPPAPTRSAGPDPPAGSAEPAPPAGP